MDADKYTANPTPNDGRKSQYSIAGQERDFCSLISSIDRTRAGVLVMAEVGALPVQPESTLAALLWLL